MRQKLFGAVVSVAAVALLALLWRQGRGPAGVPEEYREQILTYESGDYVYRYEPEEISADAETSTIYVENLLLAYTEHLREVEDPWYTGRFDRVFDLITQGCQALLETLLADEAGQA